MCVIWAGQERTVTPRLPSVISWWDPPPQFQVETGTLPLSQPSSSHFLDFIFVLHSALLVKTLPTHRRAVEDFKDLSLLCFLVHFSYL